MWYLYQIIISSWLGFATFSDEQLPPWPPESAGVRRSPPGVKDMKQQGEASSKHLKGLFMSSALV